MACGKAAKELEKLPFRVMNERQALQVKGIKEKMLGIIKQYWAKHPPAPPTAEETQQLEAERVAAEAAAAADALVTNAPGPMQK